MNTKKTFTMELTEKQLLFLYIIGNCSADEKRKLLDTLHELESRIPADFFHLEEDIESFYYKAEALVGCNCSSYIEKVVYTKKAEVVMPFKILSYDVKVDFENRRVKIGCKDIPFETVADVYSRLGTGKTKTLYKESPITTYVCGINSVSVFEHGKPIAEIPNSQIRDIYNVIKKEKS